MEALSFWDVDSVLTFLAFSIYVEILNSLQGDEQHPSEKDATREKWRNGIIRRALLQSIWSKTNPCESLRSQSQPSKSIWGEPEQLKEMRSTYKCCPQVKSNPVHPRPPDRQQRISNSGGARPVTPQVKLTIYILKLLDLRFILFLQTKKASPKHATATHHLADSLSPINSAKSRFLWIKFSFAIIPPFQSCESKWSRTK